MLLDYYSRSGDSRYLKMAQTLYADLKKARSAGYTDPNIGGNYKHTFVEDVTYDAELTEGDLLPLKDFKV